MIQDSLERPLDADEPRPNRIALYLLVVAIALLLAISALAF